MPHFSIDKSSGMGSITIGVTPAGINESQNPIQEYLKIRVGNTTTTIPLTHKAGEVTYKYIFNVSPTGNVQIGSEGGSIPYTVESIRESYIGGVLINTENNWGYQVDCDSGITNDGSTLSVGANPNSWEVTKNVKITQNDSGKTVVINITQLASSVQTDYQFFVSPTSLGYEPTGGSKNFSITSNKVTTVNGNQETTPINYSTQTSDSWIHVSGTTISVDSANAEIQRSGSVVFTQSESNKQATITITQQGNKVETSYTFTLDPTAKTIQSGGGNFSVTIVSTKTVTTNNVPETTPVSYEAKASESWIKVNGNSITVNQNSGDKNRVGTVTFTQAETGDSLVLTISQNGVTVSTSYKFSLNKSSMSFSSAGGTDNYTVASTKTVTTDGTPSTTNIGYTYQASDSWITVSNGTIRVSANNSEKSRTGSVLFTQNESGNQATLIISQNGQTVSTDYQFSVNPDNVTHLAQGGITSFSIISNKIVTTDGVPVTTQLGYTMGTLPSWITKNSNHQITIAENPNESPRSTTITFTQNESGKQVTATINQEAREPVEGYLYKLVYNSTVRPSVSFESSGGKVLPNDVIFGFKVKTIDGVPIVGKTDWSNTQWINQLTSDPSDIEVLSDSDFEYQSSDSWLSGKRDTSVAALWGKAQPYYLVPTITASANNSSSKRSGSITVSVNNVTKSEVYQVNQEGQDLSVFTFEDGSTILDMGILGSGSTMAKPQNVYNPSYWPKIRIRSVLSDGKPYASVPSTSTTTSVKGAIYTGTTDPCTFSGDNYGTVRKSEPEIIEYYFGFKGYSDKGGMWYTGKPGTATITIYQLDRDGNQTGKSIQLKYTLTGFQFNYTLQIKAAAAKLYQSSNLRIYPIKSEVVLGILNGDDTTHTGITLAVSPFKGINYTGGYTGDISETLTLFSWDWDSIKSIRAVSNQSTFYFCNVGSELTGPYSKGIGNFNYSGGMDLSPSDPFTPSSGKTFTVIVKSLIKDS